MSRCMGCGVTVRPGDNYCSDSCYQTAFAAMKADQTPLRCWHQLGKRCDCGYLATPARFYWEFVGGKPREVVHEVAESRYVAWAKAERPELYERIKGADIGPKSPDKVRTSSDKVRTSADKSCRVCGEAFTGRGLVCWRCQKRRQRGEIDDTTE